MCWLHQWLPNGLTWWCSPNKKI